MVTKRDAGKIRSSINSTQDSEDENHCYYCLFSATTDRNGVHASSDSDSQKNELKSNRTRDDLNGSTEPMIVECFRSGRYIKSQIQNNPDSKAHQCVLAYLKHYEFFEEDDHLSSLIKHKGIPVKIPKSEFSKLSTVLENKIHKELKKIPKDYQEEIKQGIVGYSGEERKEAAKLLKKWIRDYNSLYKPGEIKSHMDGSEFQKRAVVVDPHQLPKVVSIAKMDQVEGQNQNEIINSVDFLKVKVSKLTNDSEKKE